MVEVETRRLLWRKRNIWFAEPFEVDHGDAVFFYACPAPTALPGFDCTPAPTFVIDLTRSEEQLRGALSKSCRYNINRAPRDDIEVRENADIDDFEALYREFVGRKDFDGWAENFRAILAEGKLYTWYIGGRLVGGLLCLEDERNSRWLLSGSRRLEPDWGLKPAVIGRGSRLVLWHAILDAKARGLERFDLGGYYAGDDTSDPRHQITSFKQEFGGDDVMLYNCAQYRAPTYRALKALRRWR